MGLPAKEETQFQVDEAVMPWGIEARIVKYFTVNLGEETCGKRNMCLFKNWYSQSQAWIGKDF